jgi:uncharacterized membrane protein (UPF0127 family)
MIQTKINNHVFTTKVANDPQSIQEGMMGKKFDETFDAMLFVVGSKNNPEPYNYDEVVQTNKHSFWMKNCIIPLDIIFIQDNKITKIHHDCPPCLTDDCENYSGNADIVIELQGGTCKKKGIKQGQTVYFAII